MSNTIRVHLNVSRQGQIFSPAARIDLDSVMEEGGESRFSKTTGKAADILQNEHSDLAACAAAWQLGCELPSRIISS